MNKETNKPKYETKCALKIMAGMAAFLIAAVLCMPGNAFAYTQYENIVTNGHGSLNASYLVIHETANPGASAANHVNYWSNSPAYAVHYVMDVDGDPVYHTVPDNRKCWHVGNGNAYTVGIELCHATNQDDFNAQWQEAVKWAGDYLNSRGWGVDRMISHNDATHRWGGSDHTDPLSYFNAYGHSWNQFKGDVAAYMQTGEVGNGGTVVDNDTDYVAPSTSGGHSGTGFGGTYTCMASTLNIRTAPSTSAGVVGSYHRGGIVTLDDWYTIQDGYVWGRYTAYSGNVRYVAVGKPTGGVSANDYLIRGGSVSGSSVSSSSGAGDYRVTVNTRLNVRTGPGTNYRITGTLSDGYTLYNVTISNGWGKYQAYTGTRYVSAQYLDAA